ncbi:MAG TPA: HD domain-containing phosphohydrolase [Candidatus Binatia bacterium]|nr:HD domain-containing phosphohydrolase [Candidatus Binatia bacterium]
MSLSVPTVSAPEALRVLVVDDNASLLRFLVSAFSANGCAVSQAAAAEQALSLITDQPFDLVVSDIKMPGLSGLDLLRAVKGKQPGTPVVLITGNPSVNSAVFGLRHGAYDYLPKPFSIREIQQLLARVRSDRQKWDGQVPLPAGLTEELARRQLGVEVLFRIGDLALQGLETAAFVDEVLKLVVQSIKSDAALVLLRDEHGSFSSSQQGEATLVTRLLSMLQRSFDDLIATGGKEILSLTTGGEPLEAVAAVIPGVGRSMGVVCLAREAATGGFLPDERELLLGYAQTTAVALQKLILRENIERNLVDTITAFVNAIESKDRYLKGHSARVALYAGEIAQTLGMTSEMVEVVRRGAMLHDLGKLSIMDTILSKPERLTAEEFTIIKSHPVVGARILEPLRFLARETCAVRHHHERFDGTGYPDGLRGEDIPLVARVVTVADVFDAITSNRPYRTALPLEAAREEIARGCGNHFDPVVAEAFLRIPLSRLEEITRHYESLTSGGATGAPALAQAN